MQRLDGLIETGGYQPGNSGVDLDRYFAGVFAVVNASPNGRPSIF
jgi:hypothetical protein